MVRIPQRELDGGGALKFFRGRDVRHGAPKWRSKGHFFSPIRFKDLKIFNILRAYKLKFEQNLGCRTENSFNFWQISLSGVKLYHYFCKKKGSKELNHSATGDLKSGGRGLKRGILIAGHTHTTFSGAPPPGQTFKWIIPLDTSIWNMYTLHGRFIQHVVQRECDFHIELLIILCFSFCNQFLWFFCFLYHRKFATLIYTTCSTAGVDPGYVKRGAEIQKGGRVADITRK